MALQVRRVLLLLLLPVLVGSVRLQVIRQLCVWGELH
jgi:hypothetical protein